MLGTTKLWNFYQTVRGIHTTVTVPSSNDSLRCHWLNIRLCLDAEFCKWKKGRGYFCSLTFHTQGEVWYTVQFSHSVMSNYLQPHGLQQARLPCPSPTLRACSDSCVVSQGCHPPISSSGSPFLPAFNLSQHRVFSNESVLHIR